MCGLSFKIFAGVFSSIPLRNILWPNPNVCIDPQYPSYYVNVGSYYKEIWNVIRNDYETDGSECQPTNTNGELDGVDVENTLNILESLLASQGPDFLKKVFGPYNNMEKLGGVDKVARALHGKLQFINIEMF